MYIAINKANHLEFHSFEWNKNNELVVNGKQVSPEDWDIIEVLPSQQQPISTTLTKDETRGILNFLEKNNLLED
jgi:hypothetical protein